jgi:putative endonuclease|tara:strand:- start:3530 stop:3910 length:381 start_codon:yes stop_codon:yes gene_type:complete
MLLYFSKMAEHYELGNKGEQLAVNYLINKGYKIVERNWRFQKAEIDIIATKDKILISVEVKTRSTNDFGNPQDFVTPKKIKLMVSAMNEYILNKDLDIELRFDIVAITKDKSSFDIQHFKDAFLYF